MTALRVRDILALTDSLFPFDFAEKWDNCGLQIGSPDQIVEGIVVSLDPSAEAVEFTARSAAQLLVTHHPLLLKPLKQILLNEFVGKAVITAAKSDISIIALHTNLDAAPGGLNDEICSLLDLHSVTAPRGATCARIGFLSAPMALAEFADKVLKRFTLEHLSIIADDDRDVRKVFCACGSGMGYLENAVAEGADVMLTGDVRYHAALEAKTFNIPVLDAGHYGLERQCVPLLVGKLGQAFSDSGIQARLIPYNLQQNPFKILKP